MQTWSYHVIYFNTILPCVCKEMASEFAWPSVVVKCRASTVEARNNVKASWSETLGHYFDSIRWLLSRRGTKVKYYSHLKFCFQFQHPGYPLGQGFNLEWPNIVYSVSRLECSFKL